MKKYNISQSNFIALLFIGSLIFCKSIGLSSNNLIYTIIFVIGTLFTIVKIFKEKYTKKEIFMCFFMVMIGVTDYLIAKDTTLLFTGIVLSSLKNVDIKKVIKVMFIVRLLTFLGVIILTKLGILVNNYIDFYRAGEGTIRRFSFIFAHPNFAHSAFSILVFLGIYLFYDKINIFNLSIVTGMNYILYNYTYSRTGFLLCMFISIFALLYKKSNKIKKLVISFLPYSLIVFSLLSVVLGLLYDKIEIVKTMDTFLTGRLFYINLLIKNYNIPLIGSSTYNNYVNFDNGFVTLLYEGGLIAFFWFVFVSYKSCKIISNQNLYKEALLVFAFLLYSFTESYYPNILMNASLLFFALYIFKKNDKVDKKIER